MEMMIDKNIARADLYKLFAELFYEPQSQWFNENGLVKNLNELLLVLNEETGSEIKLITSSISYSQNLLIEFSRLFVGPFKLQAPPYGSYYLDEEKTVMGDSTIAVKKMYSEFGLEIAEDTKEVPDHIAIELEFMHYLAFKENEAKNGANTNLEAELLRAQQYFLKNYLSSFVQQMCEKILNGTDNSFYCSFAESLKSFIQKDFLNVSSNN